MENENELTATPAVPEENKAEETAASCCCCKDGVCSFEPPAEAEETENKEETCTCCCDDDCCCSAEAGKTEEPAAEAKTERVILPVTPEMLDDARNKLAMMLDYLGLDAEVRSESGNNKINLIVSSSDAGRIIGRKGQSLENLQFLLNRMMQKNDVNYPKVYIDIDGYSSGTKRAANDRGDRLERGEKNDRRNNRRDRGEGRGDRRNNDRKGGRRERGGDGFDMHEEELRMLALDSAKEVRRWGDPKTLRPMNAHDRRIIHVTLEKEADITTDSVGEEPNKSVVISLKK